MKTKTFVTIGILFMCGITIYLLQAVSTIESTIGTTTQIEQNNSPLPTPKPTELPEIATDAIAFISERERIPIDQLTFLLIPTAPAWECRADAPAFRA